MNGSYLRPAFGATAAMADLVTSASLTSEILWPGFRFAA